ncbi:hypothetical protein SDRG_04724 [Saprolegnia diclina VS20]|uniref:Inosine/uridine-preferring nucleoside hydrolase domain-containing protein n=1 Tax=Saprolegnia diclina (strain VS20) TaxID=1156394 RepID=T0QUJ3_SAPDV|nr:hypothetical protein SDRG_04724 [Saprolegnia diclina VS20]EQC37695.1 hypothetical protein SDRG_04724 [Saprolegnia diclina VS20]|eukprot:XP_008608628.1 hypothetical protein SDRG_04724 [Saprolegnia diclina VS20]
MRLLHPRVAPSAHRVRSRPPPQHVTWLTFAGVAYVVVAVVTGIYYLLLLRPSFSNDLWWSGYNISGYEALLVDLVNNELTTRQFSGAVDLLAPRMAMRKLYTAPTSLSLIAPTYARRLLYIELTSPDYAIPNLRATKAQKLVWLSTQLCYVDFERRLELAHTAARQRRCASRYAANGAVYMEATLRNTNFDEYLAVYGGPGGWFSVGVETALEASAYGRQWLRKTSSARNETSVADELAHWYSRNITSFQMQWTNDRDPSISETITLTNALGVALSVDIKNVPSNIGPWTSIMFCGYPANDLYFARLYNASLVRSEPNFLGDSRSFESLLGMQTVAGVFVNQSALVRAAVGPFNGIDAYYVPVPDSFQRFYASVSEVLFRSVLGTDAFSKPIVTLLPLVIAPAPASWATGNYLFAGGNPLCLSKAPTVFVQSLLDYDDACTGVTPFRLSLLPMTVLLSRLLLLSPTPGDICALDTLPSSPTCLQYLATADRIIAGSELRLIQGTSVLNDLAKLDVRMTQFATDAATQSQWTLLSQPLVDATPFAFFGAAMLLEWLMGTREVVALQGDVGDLVLISSAYASTPYATSGGSHYIKNATEIVYYITVYTTFVLCFVACLCLWLGLRDNCAGLGVNLFAFSRVVGSTWVGRSLVFLRGTTALLLLSTANVELVRLGAAWTRLQLNTRSPVEIAVLASEATWVTYAITELLVLVVPSVTAVYAPYSALAVWLSYVILEAADPVLLEATMSKQCAAINMAMNLHCESMSISIGCTSRAEALGLIALGSVGIGVATATILCRHCQSVPDNCPVVVSGVATSFISWQRFSKSTPVDRVTCAMCGLIPVRLGRWRFTFDLNLWVVSDDSVVGSERLKRNSHQLLEAIMSLRRLSTGQIPPLSDAYVPVTWYHRWSRRLLQTTSVLFLGVSTFSSITYLEVSQVTLANDLAWATFNSTGIHAYIATYLNHALLLNNVSSPLDLTLQSLPGLFSAPTYTLTIPGNVGARYELQYATSLVQTIKGLRGSSASDAAWIATSYCFVDLNRTWSLAHTSTRATRCASMVSNGAVFLETVLRNVDGDAWTAAYGDAFEIGISRALRASASGQKWLQTTMSPIALPVLDEAAYWLAHGVTAFKMQWQNYKTVGVLNSYTIENAYGFSYPFTLTALNGSYRFASQTSFKMYWGFGNDLRWVTANATDHPPGVFGSSLIVNSADYAFANASFESVLLRNGSLPSPLGPGFAAVRSTLGPFGSIDMHYIPVPQALMTAVAAVETSVRTALRTDASAAAAYTGLDIQYNAMAAPPVWARSSFVTFGGSPLCDALPPSAASPTRFSGMNTLFAFDYGCYATSYATPLLLNTDPVLFAVAMASMSPDFNASATCDLDFTNVNTCVDAIASATAFLATYVPMTLTVTDAKTLAATTVTALDVRVMQYGRWNASAPLEVATAGLLDETDFTYFAWGFLYHWAVGDHTVVNFAGDEGSLTLLSEFMYPSRQDVQSYEVPTTFATYARNCNVYITCAMMVLTVVVVVYICVCRGHVEGKNIMKLNRVGALVWVGRPLVFVRSLTALALLSTSTLRLSGRHGVSFLTPTPAPWYTIVLAASEVTWLVEVVNDIALVYTQAYTPYYAMLNTWGVWAVTSLLSGVAPVAPITTVAPTCRVAQIDMQLVCTTASIAIGQKQRLYTLLSVVFGCKIGLYASTRWWLRRAPPKCTVDSLFLSAGAKYLFSHDTWLYNDVYYLDMASAVVNGILTYRRGATVYAVDVKFWRVFAIPLPTESDIPEAAPLARAAPYTMPLAMQLLPITFDPPTTLFTDEVETTNTCTQPGATPTIAVVDANTDDFMALMYLFKEPTVNVTAVVVDGNGWSHLDEGIESLLRVIAFAGLTDRVEVGVGARYNMVNEPTNGTLYQDSVPEADVCGRNDVDSILHLRDQLLFPPRNLYLDTRPLLDDGWKVLQKHINAGATQVLSTGTLTTLNHLRLKDPTAFAKISNLVVMGGAVHAPGNLYTVAENKVAEFNIYLDPHAARDVFASSAASVIKLVGLDVTDKYPIERATLEALASSSVADAQFVSMIVNVTESICFGPTFLDAFHFLGPARCRFETEKLSVVANVPINTTVDGWTTVDDAHGARITYAADISAANAHRFATMLLRNLNSDCVRRVPKKHAC